MPGRGGWRKGAGRKAAWSHGETQTIRVPVALKDQLLDIGQQLDQGHGILRGRTYQQLQTLLVEWEVKSHRSDDPEWQPVRQLIEEIQQILLQDARPGGCCLGYGQPRGHQGHQYGGCGAEVEPGLE